MKILKAGATYFAVVFAAGFIFGTIRTLWIVPRLGARTAELLESPLMLVVIILAARWIVTRFALPASASSRLGAGFFALGLTLVAELSLVFWLRGLTLREYFATRDPVSGVVYDALLVLMAVLPVFVSHAE